MAALSQKVKPALEDWSERNMQRSLFWWLQEKGHELICPNCGVFGWDADLVSVTTAGYSNEYEIKISRSDFRADAKKRKHKRLLSGPGNGFIPPSQFWYAVPAGLVSPEEIPAHAGLIELRERRPPQVVVQAPRLHTRKADDRQLRYLGRGLMMRFWKSKQDNP